MKILIDIIHFIENYHGLIELFFITITALCGIFIFYRLNPTVCINLMSKQVRESIILTITIENKSKVRIKNAEIYLQVLEYNKDKYKELSEWVPFEREKVLLALEPPNEWKNPEKFLTTTECVFSGEIITCDRLLFCNKENFLHIGVKVKANLYLLARIAMRMKKQQEWTSTYIVYFDK